jgi:hypothetical protein
MLKSLPQTRYDTSYFEYRQAAWDGYIEVRGNRYSIPSMLAGQTVRIRIGLDDSLRVYDQAGSLAASHQLVKASSGWQTIAEHHSSLWQSTVKVEQRPLDAYEEAAAWS